ncbi:MAG: RHS repeat-associated core domain-containing protein [Anaerolineae bacterium]
MLYKPCPLRYTAGVLREGETRYSSGSTPTTWRFTGQREDATIGLYFYNARYLDPQLGRFTQPDTIVPAPGNPQALNRYSYVLNNPLRYTDPTGMFSEDEIMGYLGVSTWDDVLAMFGEGGVMAGAWGFLEVLRQAELGDPISMWYDISGGMSSIAPHYRIILRAGGSVDVRRSDWRRRQPAVLIRSCVRTDEYEWAGFGMVSQQRSHTLHSQQTVQPPRFSP